MKKFKKSRLSTDFRKLQTLALKHHEVFSCLQSHQHLDIRVFSKRLYHETLAKHPVHDSDFVLLYIDRLAQ